MLRGQLEICLNNYRLGENVKINVDKFNVKLMISQLFDICIYDIDICLELLFNKLGFKDSDEINVLNMDDNGNMYFNVNNEFDYVIKIRNNVDDRYPVVFFKNKDGIEYGYQCIFREVKRYISLSVNRFKYGYKINNNLVNYEIGSDFVEYRLELLDKRLEFRLSKPSKYVNRNGYYVSYEIPHHKGIVNYLSKLDNIDSILDIYNDLCILKIGDDMCKHDDIDVRIMKNDEYGNYDVSELIQLENGNLTMMIIKKNGYSVSYSNGRWLCDNDRLQVMYEKSNTNGIMSINTRVHLLCEDTEYNDKMVCRDIINADNEVNDVKKLVRKMFNNRDGNQNSDLPSFFVAPIYLSLTLKNSLC